jgi:hypothetical protein
MFLTAQLVFTIFMLATEKHEGTFIAPVGIGLASSNSLGVRFAVLIWYSLSSSPSLWVSTTPVAASTRPDPSAQPWYLTLLLRTIGSTGSDPFLEPSLQAPSTCSSKLVRLLPVPL